MQKTTMFVAACCHWPHDHDSQLNVEQAANAVDDWHACRQVVTRHRVIPLVHLAVKDLDTVPADFRAWAKQGAQATARHAMQLTHDCIKIDGAFKAANIDPLHFKGPVLGQIAYGSVALKYSNDLDIFVNASDVPAAVAILEAANYRAFGRDRPVSKRQLSAMIRNFKDLGFIGPKGTMVELHWRFIYNSGLLTGLEDNLTRAEVTIANAGILHTLGPAQMLEYLIVHGAAHNWIRLKWLADFAAFLDQIPASQSRQMIDTINRGPTGDVLAQTLKLCDTLFGTRHSPKMSCRAEVLYAYALSRIDRPYTAPTSFWGDIGFITDVVAARHLYTSLWSALWSLKSHLYCVDDAMALPLPAHLNGLYPIIRLPSLLLRRLRG